MIDLPSEEVDERGGAPRGRWVESAPTAIWEPDKHPAPASRRETAPYASTSRAAAAELEPEDDPEVEPPRRERAGGSASRARAAAVDRSERGQAVVRFQSPRQAHEFEGRSTRPEPLMIEAPLLIRIRNADRISPDPRLWVMTQPGSGMAEQFRVLSLKLKEQPGLRVVALAGATLRCQGALAAANVALALGEGTRNRVLLLDADLRQPQIGELFGMPSGPGLSDQIRRHRRHPDEPWEMAGVSGTVSLLLAGSTEKNPAAVLSSESIGDLMHEARRAFDYVVVSPPPVLESADANILQDHLDGAILVVRAGHTRRQSVQASIDRLGARHFLGTVLLHGR